MPKSLLTPVIQEILLIGVDVSKAELVVVGIKSGESYIKYLNNERKAIKLFARSLSKSGYQGRIICESTGHYHLNPAVICHEYGLRLIVLNPLQSSKHSKARIRKTKTDPEDGRVLATMCLTEPKLPNPSKLTLNKTLIRLTMGQLASLEKQIQQQRQSLRQYEEQMVFIKRGSAEMK